MSCRLRHVDIARFRKHALEQNPHKFTAISTFRMDVVRRVDGASRNIGSLPDQFDTQPLAIEDSLDLLQAQRAIGDTDDTGMRIADLSLRIEIVVGRNAGQGEIAAAARELCKSPAPPAPP